MTIMCFVYYNYFILCCFVFGITQKKKYILLKYMECFNVKFILFKSI